MKSLFIYLGFICLFSPLTAQQLPEVVPIVQEAEDVKPFSVSAEILTLYRLDSTEEILANENRYLVSDTPPTKVNVALIFVEGDSQRWIVVRPVAGGRSIKLVSFERNQFIFEHSGVGEYEVTTLDSNREPVFSYFIIEDMEQPTDPEKPGDFAGLIEIAKANSNGDLETRKALGEAWLKVINQGGKREEIQKARSSVLSMVKDQDGSWNQFFLAVDGWFRSQALNETRYIEAVGVLAQWMIK